MTNCLHYKQLIVNYENTHFECYKQNKEKWQLTYTKNNLLFDRLVSIPLDKTFKFSVTG